MYEIRRTPAAQAEEQAMPESLSVAFGAYLDELAADPWLLGDAWDSPRSRIDTFGLSGRGIVAFVVNDAEDPHVLITQLNY